MRLFSVLAFSFLVLSAMTPAGSPALAGNDDPLFVNLTSDDGHRASMALSFTAKQQARTHPVTVYLNDRAVAIAAKSKAAQFGTHQKAIGEILAAGGVVLICPMCMKHYGVAETDLIDGVKVSNPELVEERLFEDDVQTLTW
ncbi:MAG: DsrE family protein [Hyphomicrobiaceae bacterium]